MCMCLCVVFVVIVDVTVFVVIFGQEGSTRRRAEGDLQIGPESSCCNKWSTSIRLTVD